MKKKPKVTDAQRSKLTRLIHTAALILDDRGRIAVLAKKARVTPEAIHQSIRRGYFTTGMASSIELAVGREHLKREDLCLPCAFSD